MPPFDSKQKAFYSQNFNNKDFSCQILDSIEFEDCSFEECNFSNATFKQCKFIECRFVKCNLSMVNIAYSQFNDVCFETSKIVGIDWTKGNWPNLALFSPIKFTDCIINDCLFFGLELKELVLENCKAHDVDFREGDFSQSNFSYSDFSNSLFSKTNLQGVNFIEASNYQIDIYNNNITKAKFSRYQAVALLDSLDIELSD
ncbi:MAG: pentapeptide repeat-containing protein [Colwellia sp.]|nr:pentapeptide repeat-containing protein [Colwellia sp.]